MGEGHLPVLVEEVLAFLALAPGSSVADCTVGGGGHAERILETTSPDGRLLGLDADRAAITEAEHHLAKFGDRVELRQANFASLLGVATEAGFVPLDAVLFDLGLSSYQLADPRRGFSFASDAAPDMRFDEEAGLSALELIDSTSERELAGILATFGEERRAGRVAKAIVAAQPQRSRCRPHPSRHTHIPGAAYCRQPRARSARRGAGRGAGRAPSPRTSGSHQLPLRRGPHREALHGARKPGLRRGAAATGLHLWPQGAVAPRHQGRRDADRS
jgi:hypothetical protein